MVQIEWSARAQLDVLDIRDYIHLDSPKASQKIVQGIYDKISTIQQFPQFGYLRDRDEVRERELRIALYGHYKIIYYYYNAKNLIYLVGVSHGARDLQKFLTV